MGTPHEPSGSCPLPPPKPGPSAPAPKTEPVRQGPEGTLEALRRLCAAAGAVTLELSVGGCSVRVPAESLEQLGAVAGFLGAIAGVSDLGTGGGGQ